METPQPPDQPPYSPPPSEPTSQPAPPTDPGGVTQQHADQVAAQQQAAAQAQQAAAQAAQQQAQQQAPQQGAQAQQQQAYYAYTQPAYGQQQQYQQPYAYPQQPQQPYYQPGAYYQPYYAGPDNGLATGSLVTAVISIAALVFTAGFSAPVSIIASIVSIFLGHKGKKAVDEGRTAKNRDVAVAGFWTGIAGVVLSVLSIVGWVIFFVAVANTGGEADPGDLASLWDALAPIFGA